MEIQWVVVRNLTEGVYLIGPVILAIEIIAFRKCLGAMLVSIVASIVMIGVGMALGLRSLLPTLGYFGVTFVALAIFGYLYPRGVTRN